MTQPHRSGAPRLIEWTGERCVPWAPDVQVVYEHLHRYLWAAQLIQGRRVLDLASGEGFGAAILAEQAESVVGIELDERTVAHSQLNYGGEKVEFQLGDALDLTRFEDGSFGAVVAFEMIEHVSGQERVLAEIARVLAPDGLLLMSTPDRNAYTVATAPHNPFHVHELDRTQFTRLIGSKFQNVATWGQRTITGSALSALDGSAPDAPARTFFVERHGDVWDVSGGLSALYLVAVASDAELPAIPHDSTLADAGIALLRAAQGASDEAAEQRLRQAAADVERSARERERLEAERRELRRTLSDRDVELDLRRNRIAQLEQDKVAVAELRSELAAAQQLTERVQQSVSWKLFERGRGKLLAALGGPRSIPTRALRRALRGIGEAASGRPGSTRASGASSPAALLELPEFEQPRVSIVIPLYSGADLTWKCLESIRDRTIGVSYEVILVDDAADEDTKALLAGLRGARIVVNRTNLGYLRSVKRGAAAAHGDWLVLCNNDIIVQQDWLTAMLGCAESSPDVGVVTPKYLYPDGALNEAGAIIWRDGTGVNYGRGGSPGDCPYEFRREVDYGSAAALMVRADFWRQIGGFDERFTPMYYEDADLCFQARGHGLRVVYEPRANVVHLEGGTAGTDLTSGPKRYQEINRPRFVAKWRQRLESDQLPAGRENVRRASNRHRGPHVLILDHRVPMWDRDAGSLRMLAMIRALIELGCRITFFPDDRGLVIPYTLDLQRMGVEVWYGEFDIWGGLSEIGPGLAMVIASRPHATSRWLDLMRDRAPRARIVYDTVDLHWLREARRAGLADSSEQVMLGSRAAALREIELALIRATDATLVVSAEERAQVQADVPGAVVRIVPTINEIKSDVPPAQRRRGVIFIGGFEHTPNVDAVLRLITRVMPRVWSELGDVPVTIIGDAAPPEISALASPLVDIAGWVKDVDPLFDAARAMVAPISYGAGLKGKVTQALAAGLPVVTTPVGAEGLDAVDGEHLLIGKEDRELADRVIRVLGDDELWTSLSGSGQRLAAERCSPEVVTRELGELLGRRPSRSGVSGTA